MTVYAVHPLGKTDVSSALTYGDIEYINHRYIFADEIDANGKPPRAFCKNIASHLGEFNPSMDYLLIAGDHLQLLMVTAWLAQRWDEFRVLRYDREAKGYVSVLIGG